MSKKDIVNIIFIIEMLVFISVCNIVMNNMNDLTATVRSEALNGNSKPAADVFKNMRNDLTDYSKYEIKDTAIKIYEIIKEYTYKLFDYIDNKILT